MTQQKLRLMITVLTAVILCACSETNAVVPVAANAAAGFHDRFNARDFVSIFQASHKDFKKSGSLHSFKMLMQTVYAKLGKVESSTTQNWSARKMGDARLVALHQKTAFEKGVGYETFQYLVRDGMAVLTGYTIDARNL